jgi:UDP-N-acetylmuramoyl-L-alanyl-D-glutamate--2,6-diaminopimelate ligase
MGSTGLPLEMVARRLREAELLLTTQGSDAVTILGVTQDSRQVAPGDLFLAWKGLEHDAHEFLPQAAASGAVAAVVERISPDLAITQLQVRNGRLAGALAADVVLNSPWTRVFLAGITGTNGKTTVAVLAQHLLNQKGPTRAVGTLGLVEEPGTVRPGTEGLTTPGPVQISSWLREMADDGVAHATLEASSHALDQDRLAGVRFDVAVFTNLSQEHLDYHPDLGSYRSAKARLLGLLKPGGRVVLNRDDAAWKGLPLPAGETLFFGFGDTGKSSGFPGAAQGADGRPGKGLWAEDVDLLPHGCRFRLRDGGEEAWVDLPLLGRFNVENALAAAGIARVAGLGIDEIAAGLSSAPQIPGRLEKVAGSPFTVLIDFAHTPDALERVLATLRPLAEGRLLVLFGAGGDRDRGKRSLMGEVASRLGDLVFVTSDNPRTEDPEGIIDDVVAGMEAAPLRRICDRREAILAALTEARPGDLLLLAGKGHETYQVLGHEKHPFDEGAIVRAALGMEEPEGRG